MKPIKLITVLVSLLAIAIIENIKPSIHIIKPNNIMKIYNPIVFILILYINSIELNISGKEADKVFDNNKNMPIKSKT